MTDKSQLPFLLKLLGDPAPRVQDKVRGTLRCFGPDLKQEIADYLDQSGVVLNAVQRTALDEIFADCAAEYEDFAALWRAIQTSDDEWFKLESALAFLSRWQFELENGGQAARYYSLRALLDELAEEYRETSEERDALSLANWLFGVRGLGGVTPEDYYHPLNSNLVHVLQGGRGLPISLAAIFMLTGQRLDIEVHGCAFPSHFLARSGVTFFDCYNGGRVLGEKESRAILKVMPDALLPSNAAPIIARVLFNLINAYQQSDEYEKARQCLSLLEQLKQLETAI
jgi:regulator of sirC expression with transglutaminase-like and TPR domain